MTYAVKFAVHVAIAICAVIASYSLRRGLGIEWWSSNDLAGVIFGWALVNGVVAAAYELLIFRNERSAWSYTSVSDVFRLVQATALTALTVLALIFFVDRGLTLPRSTLILSWIMSLFGLVGVRLAFRLSIEGRFGLLGFADNASDERPMVLVGDPRQAAAYLKRHAAEGALNYDPVGIVGKNTALLRQVIHGVPVIGQYQAIEDALRSRALPPGPAPALLFLEDPIKDLQLEPDTIGRLRAAGHALLRLPRPSDLSAAKGVLREISLEELLPREPIALDPERLHGLVGGKRVLVTGAGGSIGSEICRQLVALDCSEITLVDQSEFLLFEIDRQLAELNSSIRRAAVLGDVRDQLRLSSTFNEARPDIVFHAAALKHVRLVELNPCEAVLTNVVGTSNVANAAQAAGVGQLVVISTDKAVDPTSFMGATKRLAESLLPKSSSRFRCCVVRFGNVLGSAGSVVPIFQKQIANGGPVTVTHPDVTRFFMTIPEAVQLVLHAAAINSIGGANDTRKFVLEMGKPVQILSLARQLIELSGLQPDKDIEIVFSGLNPGEKLDEELLDSNEETTLVDVGLSEIHTQGKSMLLSRKDVEQLSRIARTGDVDATRKVVTNILRRVRGNPSTALVDVS